MASFLCAIDFSEGSEEGAELAARLAESRDAKLVLLHVETASEAAAAALSEQSRKEHEAWLEGRLKTAQRRLRSAEKVDAVIRICEGGPSSGIVEVAAELGPDLVVIGSHGSGLRHLLLGSVAQKVAREANHPVLVVRGETTTVPFMRVLVCVDFSEVSMQLVKSAAQLCDTSKATIELLHIAQLPAHHRTVPHRTDVREMRETVHREALERLDALAASLALPEGTTTTVRDGPVAGTILEHAVETGADVIAVATHEPRGLGQRVLGTTADRVLRHADVPVLVLPANAR